MDSDPIGVGGKLSPVRPAAEPGVAERRLRLGVVAVDLFAELLPVGQATDQVEPRWLGSRNLQQDPAQQVV